MSTILHLSDPHFGTELPAVVEALLRLAQSHAPDVLILSGDVTQRARRRQFAAAVSFLKTVGIRHTLVIPGNHDIPLFNFVARLVSPYRNYLSAFQPLEPEVELRDMVAIGVNTTRPNRHTVGAVSSEQIERVSRRLRSAAPGQLRVVVTHQPVQVIREKDLKNLLRGRREAVEAWAAAGADLILGGHIHLPYVRPFSEVIPNLPRPVWAVQAGTALSWRIRSSIPNSVNIIRYDAAETPRHCIVDRWDYGTEKDEFFHADQHILHLQE